MGQRELEKLAAKIKNEVRAEGQIIDVGRDYGLTVINLILTGITGGYVTNDLYFARGDQDPIYPGAKCDEPLEWAADEAQRVLKKVYDWAGMARKNKVRKVEVTVEREGSPLPRSLYDSGGGQVEEPDDPMIMF